MRLAHIGAGGPVEKWFEFKSGTQRAEFLLRFAKASDWHALTQKHGSDESKLVAELARTYFVDFRNIEDTNGAALENTEEVRRAILEDVEIKQFVVSKLARTAEWRAEGNADSGSD